MATMCELIETAAAEIAQEAAMRDRYAGQPFTPCSLADAARHDARSAFWAIDSDGNLYLIGSDQDRRAK